MSRGHNDGNPRGRWSIALLGVLWLSASACAHGAKPAAAKAPAGDLAERVELLSQRLAERDQLVTQLESRLSLLEAEQRQLRYALAEREAAPQIAPRGRFAVSRGTGREVL